MGLTRIRAQQITDIDYKQAVRVVTTGDVTLSGGAPTVVDGVTLVQDNRILVRAQSNAAENGIYFVSTLGTGSDGTWTRTNDANQTGEIAPGMVVMVTEGTIYADTPWKLITNGNIVIGVTELTFEQFSNGTAAGANTQIQFNNAGDFAGSANLTWNGSELYVNGTANIANLVISGNVTGNLLPAANVTYDLGSPDQRWKDLYLSNTTIYIGSAEISSSGADLLLPANVHVGNAILSEHNGILTLPENIATVTISATGNITGGNLITAGTVSTIEIVKTGSNNVGNIGQADNTFDTVFAKATSAQYADLAECYAADQSYPVGTVLVIGGAQEVTESTDFAQTTIIGTVSDKPAYIMNSGIKSDHVAVVALTGRVPVRVVGNINRGDLLTSSPVPGHATALAESQWRPGAVVGKALEPYNSMDPGIIEAIVGRL